VLVNGRLRASISRASGRVRYADEVTRRELLREQPAHFWWPGARWLRPIGGGRLHVEQHFAGFDYPLQADPRRLWELSVEGVRKAAEPYPELPFAIEYKPEEPRTHLFFSDAARTLLAIEDIGLANVGILIDFGHSLYGGESPAAAVELCVARGRLIDVDLNDNFRSWDDDMTVGSVHLVETLEFLLSLKRAGWDKPWKLDQFPFREDPVEAARASVRMLAALLALAERIDPDELAAARENQDAIAAQRLAYDILFGEIVKPE
jgi:xylose isomerase